MERTTINIKGLRVYAYHGVQEQERTVGNEFMVDVTIEMPLWQAMRSDNLAHTLNYASAIQIIQREMAVPSRLIENVAYRIQRALITSFPSITGGKVSVCKLTPAIAGAQIESVSFTFSW